MVNRSYNVASLGAVDPGVATAPTFTNRATGPTALLITYELRCGGGPRSSSHRLLLGWFKNGRATLSVADVLTLNDAPLRKKTGQCTMLSRSGNTMHDYPSFEESGIWLLTMAPHETG